jgi:vacuolar-type H+-ATPase subunit H
MLICLYKYQLSMSSQDKKETSVISSSTSQNSDNSSQGKTPQNNPQSFNRFTEENNQSLHQSLDETKKNIQKSLDESRNQIPRYAKTISDAQEQTIQATKEISDNYIEYQKEAINTLQSIFSPFKNANNSSWDNQDYFKKVPELYSKIINNYAENTIALSRMFNDLVFANIDSFKNISNNVREYSKHFSEIGKRNARICKGIHQNNQDIFSSKTPQIDNK